MATSTLDATAKGTTSNSFVTLAVADQYHDDRPAVGTTWSSATDDAKTKALLWATLVLTSLWEWKGYVTSNDQKLPWPRTGLMERHGGDNLDKDTIPEEIQYATSEMARALMLADRAADNEIEANALSALRAGPIFMQFRSDIVNKVVPDIVFHLIPGEWGTLKGRASGTIPSVRT